MWRMKLDDPRDAYDDYWGSCANCGDNATDTYYDKAPVCAECKKQADAEGEMDYEDYKKLVKAGTSVRYELDRFLGEQEEID